MKAKEFWVSDHGYSACIYWDGPPNFTQDYYLAGHKLYHVREVREIDWKKLWEEHDIIHKALDEDLDNMNGPYPPDYLQKNIERLVEKQLAGEE